VYSSYCCYYKIHIKLTTRYFGVNPTLLDSETCYLAIGVLNVCFEQVRHLQSCWSELGILGYVWNTLVLIGLTMLLKILYDLFQGLNLFVSDTLWLFGVFVMMYVPCVCLFAYCLLFLIGDRIERRPVHGRG
jgi:hypothetical protein